MTQNRRRTTVEAAVINHLILHTLRNEHDINLGHKGPFFKASETLRHSIHEMKMLRRCSKPKSKMPLQCLFRTLPYCVGTVNFVTAVIQVVQEVITTINNVQNLIRLYKRVVGILLKDDIECLQALIPCFAIWVGFGHPSSVKNSIFGTTKWLWFQPFARCKWDIRSVVILISIDSQLVTGVSGKFIASILKGQTDPWGWERNFVQKQKLTLGNLPESDDLTNCSLSWFCLNNRINNNTSSYLFPVKKFSPLWMYLSCFLSWRQTRFRISWDSNRVIFWAYKGKMYYNLMQVLIKYV